VTLNHVIQRDACAIVTHESFRNLIHEVPHVALTHATFASSHLECNTWPRSERAVTLSRTSQFQNGLLHSQAPRPSALAHRGSDGVIGGRATNDQAVRDIPRGRNPPATT
jgi:hypothetical protein